MLTPYNSAVALSGLVSALLLIDPLAIKAPNMPTDGPRAPTGPELIQDVPM